MITKRVFEKMITAEEAAELAKNYSTLDDLFTADEIYKAAMKGRSRDTKWEIMCSLAAVYIAGRVQGIREERQRRKNSCTLSARKGNPPG